MSQQDFKSTAIISQETLRKLGLMPPEDRLRKGPVAIIECPEMIPCNICADACPYKAISLKNINAIPQIDWNKCIGCGVCVTRCPGLAIFVVDLSKPGKAYVTLPHEFNPKPKIGDKVTLLNRSGLKIGKGRVVKIIEWNKTLAVTVEVPRNYVMEVRAIWKEE